MTEVEFVQATSRLEKYYDKEYTQNQSKEMYNFFKDWSISKYITAINYCLKTSKYLPKIADLMNVNTDDMQPREREKIDFVECNKCNGEGFVKYLKSVPNGDKTLKYEYVALCTCKNGEKQRNINGYRLPTTAEIGI